MAAEDVYASEDVFKDYLQLIIFERAMVNGETHYPTDQRCNFITHAKSGTDFGISSHSISYRLTMI